jgi:hypothetical protein
MTQLQKGMKVRVVSKTPLGDSCWINEMDPFVDNGEVFEIIGESGTDFRLNTETSKLVTGGSLFNWWFPAETLQVAAPTLQVAAPQFRAGDKVKVVRSGSDWDGWISKMDYHVGHTYTVLEADENTYEDDDYDQDVLLNTEKTEDEVWNSRHSANWYFPNTVLELVEPAPPSALEKASKDDLIKALNALGILATVEKQLAA